MNRIVLLDEKNLFVAVEPGVTYEQLQEYLLGRGYRVMIPFGVPPKRSVLTSYLERDPVMAAASFEHGNALIMDTEIVLPTGELLRTGVWSSSDKPGGFMGPVRHVLYRLWTGAQGTLGIMTKMCLHVHRLINDRKIFFIPFGALADALEGRLREYNDGRSDWNVFSLMPSTWPPWRLRTGRFRQPSLPPAGTRTALPG